MKTVLMALHITVSILLIFAILIQQRGAGLSSTFGGSGGGNFYAAKRGAEKILGIITIVLAVLFAGLSLGMIFVE